MFTKLLSHPISSLNLYYEEYLHPCGALIISVQNDDPENAFLISLPTYTEDSTGVPHILEHTVLCGSEKFPVRDPFFSMIKRSLNTYLNANTWTDRTTYPAASQVKRDFYNLLEVYLDAVFHPLLRKESFLQEGHRLELSSQKKLEIKGIVYNEMKGALAGSEEYIWYAFMESLFPKNAYGYNFGGIPKDILNLTHDDLIQYHQKHYSPSNAIFYFYGNLPIEKHLTFLEEKLLCNTQKENKISYPKVPSLEKPQVRKSFYPSMTPDHDTHYVTIGWALSDICDIQSSYEIMLLDQILMGSDASPLKKGLLEGELCDQVSSIYEKDIKTQAYLFQFQGIEEINLEEIENKLIESLQKVAQAPFSKTEIESAFHQIALQQKEITRDHSPYGLEIGFSLVSIKQYGGSAEDYLDVDRMLQNIEDALEKDPLYLNKRLEKFLLHNKHRITEGFSPSKKLYIEQVKEEQKLLQDTEKALSEEDIDNIHKEMNLLKSFQEEPEDLNCLPKLILDDIPKEVKHYPLESKETAFYHVHQHASHTHHLSYWDCFLPLANLSEDLLPWLSLYTSFLTELGSGNRCFEENLKYAQRFLGDFDASIASYSNPFDQSFSAFLHLNASAFESNIPYLTKLLIDTVEKPHLEDLERLKNLLIRAYNDCESTLTSNAFTYAKLGAAQFCHQDAYLEEKFSGISYYLWLRKLYKQHVNNPKFIATKLLELHDNLFHSGKPHIVITAEEKLLKSNKETIHKFCQELSNSRKSLQISPFILPSTEHLKKEHTAYALSSSVAFTHYACKGVNYADPLCPALRITGHLLRNRTLHKRVREQGGAYGVNAHALFDWENFHFSSYSDPHLKQTLDAFKASLDEVPQASHEELEEAILNAIASMDAPVSPCNRGLYSFENLMEGKSLEWHQSFKKQLLATSIEGVIFAVEKILIPSFSEGVLCSCASKPFFDKKLPKLFPVKLIEV